MVSPDPTPDTGAIASLMVRLRGDRALHAISVNTIWLVVDRMYGLALSVVVTVLVVRYLGPVDFGLLSYATALVGIVAPLAQLGLDTIVVRELVAEPEARNEILGTAFALMLISSVVLVPLAIGGAALASGGDRRTIMLVTILAVQYLLHSFDVVDFWFRSGLQSRYTVLSSKLGLTGNALLCLWLIHRHAAVEGFAYAMILEIAVAMGGLVVLYHRSGGRLKTWTYRTARAKDLLHGGTPLLVATLAGTVYAKAGFIILRELTTSREVGLYSAAVRISELCYFIPMAIVVSVFPSVVRNRASLPQEEQRARTQALFDLMALLGYAVVIPATLLARLVMPLIFGSGYGPAGSILAIHIWTFVFVCIGMARGNWLVAEGRTAAYMVAACTGAVIHVAVALSLIPRFGASGAAWAALAAQAFIVFGSSFLLSGLRPTLRPVALALAVPLRLRSVSSEWRRILKQRP